MIFEQYVCMLISSFTLSAVMLKFNSGGQATRTEALRCIDENTQWNLPNQDLCIKETSHSGHAFQSIR